MKTKEENPNGLYQKYLIKKIIGWKDSDFGYFKRPLLQSLPPEFEAFVLRLDEGQKDKNHLSACRIAVNAYANAIQPHIPELAKDLKERYPVSKKYTLEDFEFGLVMAGLLEPKSDYEKEMKRRLDTYKKL